jgi:asparagine synthase (glutamine-hydrolysing)
MAIPAVILAIESYDITTVRASVGQYLISKWISENTDIKVLLIGDVSDELTSGYLYFHKAPDAKTSHLENIRLLEDIHYFDVLRADRCISHCGLEARLPFADYQFVNHYLSCDPDLRLASNNKIEKWLLREAFSSTGLLPKEVLWRQKCAFSDGVSEHKKSWFQIIQDHIQDFEIFSNVKVDTTYLTPPTKEAKIYRQFFTEFYGNEVATIIPYYWLPKWVGNTIEPSARVLDVCNE